MQLNIECLYVRDSVAISLILKTVALTVVVQRFIKLFAMRSITYGRLRQRQQLTNRVEIRQSGCLDRCESGTVVAVYRASWQNFAWLPDKIQRKLRKLLFPNRHLYGQLKREDIPAIVESHFGKGRPLKRCQIESN
jgi:(2Fe-2S) ferredoxin